MSRRRRAKEPHVVVEVSRVEGREERTWKGDFDTKDEAKKAAKKVCAKGAVPVVLLADDWHMGEGREQIEKVVRAVYPR